MFPHLSGQRFDLIFGQLAVFLLDVKLQSSLLSLKAETIFLLSDLLSHTQAAFGAFFTLDIGLKKLCFNCQLITQP